MVGTCYYVICHVHVTALNIHARLPHSLPLFFLLQELQSSCAREVELEHSLTERTDALRENLLVSRYT